MLDSLFTEVPNFIEGAPVDAFGNASEKARKETFITFDRSRFDRIKSSKQAFLEIFFSTTNKGQESVKVYADQIVDIRMGMRAVLKQ